MSVDYEYRLGGFAAYKAQDKKANIDTHVRYMINRCMSMFRWEGLPNTIPERTLELNLLVRGHTTIYPVNGVLYTDTGALGGIPNQVYMPTLSIIANPFQAYNAQLKINEECVVIPNDDLYMGLIPMLSRYADLLTEAELSLKMTTIITRLQKIISASDDRTKKSAEEYLKRIVAGDIGIIADKSFVDENSLSVHDNGNANGSGAIKNIIEEIQFLKGSEFNEIGLQALFNMKRESINSSEASLNDDAIVPLTDTMLRSRQRACEKVNEMFGTDWSVDYSSAWKDNQTEIAQDLSDPEAAPEEKPDEAPEETPEEKKGEDEE